MGGKKSDAQKINAQERRIKALELRKQGYPYRTIGATLEVSAVQAHEDVMTALKELADIETGKADELRQLELLRLDALYLSLDGKLKAKDLGAIDRAVKIIDSKAKLLGLALPSKVELSGSIALSWESLMKANEDDKAADSESPFA